MVVSTRVQSTMVVSAHMLARPTDSLHAQAAYGPLSDSSPSSAAGTIDGLMPAAARQEVEGSNLLVAALTRCMWQTKISAHPALNTRYDPRDIQK